jgi:hypothetical protein
MPDKVPKSGGFFMLQGQLPLLSLPNELLDQIINKLKPETHLSLLATCRRLRAVVAANPQSVKDLGEFALGKGYLKVMLWAQKQGAPWNDEIYVIAAGLGHMRILEYGYNEKVKWNVVVCSSAAAGGHLKVLQWLREHGAPWNEWTCEQAAEEGHLKLLKWAYEQRAPLNVKDCLVAVRIQLEQARIQRDEARIKTYEEVEQWVLTTDDSDGGVPNVYSLGK